MAANEIGHGLAPPVETDRAHVVGETIACVTPARHSDSGRGLETGGLWASRVAIAARRVRLARSAARLVLDEKELDQRFREAKQRVSKRARLDGVSRLRPGPSTI